MHTRRRRDSALTTHNQNRDIGVDSPNPAGALSIASPEAAPPVEGDIFQHSNSLVQIVDRVGGIMCKADSLIGELCQTEVTDCQGTVVPPPYQKPRMPPAAAKIRKCVTPSSKRPSFAAAGRDANTLAVPEKKKTSRSVPPVPPTVPSPSHANAHLEPPEPKNARAKFSDSPRCSQTAFARTHSTLFSKSARKTVVERPAGPPPPKRPNEPKTPSKKHLAVPPVVAPSSRPPLKSPKTGAVFRPPLQSALAQPTNPKTPKGTGKSVKIQIGGEELPAGNSSLSMLASSSLLPLNNTRSVSDSPILTPEEYGESTGLTPMKRAFAADTQKLGRTLKELATAATRGAVPEVGECVAQLARFFTDKDGSVTAIEICVTHYNDIMQTLLVSFEAMDDVACREGLVQLVHVLHSLAVPDEMLQLLLVLCAGQVAGCSTDLKCVLWGLLTDLFETVTVSGGSVCATKLSQALPVVREALDASVSDLRKRSVFVYVSLYKCLKVESLQHFTDLSEKHLKLCQFYLSKEPEHAKVDLQFEVDEHLLAA